MRFKPVTHIVATTERFPWGNVNLSAADLRNKQKVSPLSVQGGLRGLSGPACTGHGSGFNAYIVFDSNAANLA